MATDRPDRDALRRRWSNAFGLGCLAIFLAVGGFVVYNAAKITGKLPLNRQETEQRLKLVFPDSVRTRCYFEPVPPGWVIAEAQMTGPELEQFRQANGIAWQLRPLSHERVQWWLQVTKLMFRHARRWNPQPGQQVFFHEQPLEASTHRVLLVSPEPDGSFVLVCLVYG